MALVNRKRGELMVETYSTVEEMEARFRTPAATFYRWRTANIGPKAIKVGRKLLYPESAVQEWLRDLEQAERPRVAL
jgi:predicted DNA-binding transcriptional regulator AlpA